MLATTDKDLASLDTIFEKGCFQPPNIKISIYKNRRGRYKGLYLWCKASLGTCRIEPMFVTTYNYELVNVDDTKVIIEEGAF